MTKTASSFKGEAKCIICGHPLAEGFHGNDRTPCEPRTRSLPQMIARVESGTPLREVLGNKGRTRHKDAGTGLGNTINVWNKEKRDMKKFHDAKERYDKFIKNLMKAEEKKEDV